MKKRHLCLIIASTCILCACGNDNIRTDENIQYTAPKFEITNNTISKQSIVEQSNKIIITDTSNKEDVGTEINYGIPDYSSAELQLENNDTSVEYEIQGSDIIYKDIKFIGLYDAVTNIEQPYDLNTFINFLVKTYDSKGEKQVNTNLIKDNLTDASSTDIGEVVTIHESLMERQGYLEISNKYNDTAVWSISLYTGNFKNQANISGCKSFIVYNGTSDLYVDMSEFDLTEFGKSTEETETSSEETETSSEETETEMIEVSSGETDTEETEVSNNEKIN